MDVKCIGCIGAGHVGATTMAVLALKNPGVQVVVFDDNTRNIAAWNAGHSPVFEPGLSEMVSELRGKNLTFTSDIKAMVDKAEVVFVSVNAPTKQFGVGAGKAADLTAWEHAARRIAETAVAPKIVVERSTAPVRTGEIMAEILSANETGLKFDVLCVPAFMRAGNALQDMLSAGRFLLGGENDKAMDTVQEIFHWAKDSMIRTNLWSAELSKLACNAMIAQRISSTNSVAALCERTGADVNEVMRAVGMDARIGSGFLQCGPGFGGSSLRQNLVTLVYLCGYFGLKEVAHYWETVLTMNEYVKARFTTTILDKMHSSLQGKMIAVLGFAFKKDTNDTQESPAIDVCKELLAERACVHVYDPQVSGEKVMRALGAKADTDDLHVAENVPAAVAGAHAVVLLTEWDEFRSIDWKASYAVMEKPAFVFDGRGMLDIPYLESLGFRAYSIGRPDPSAQYDTFAS